MDNSSARFITLLWKGLLLESTQKKFTNLNLKDWYSSGVESPAEQVQWCLAVRNYIIIRALKCPRNEENSEFSDPFYSLILLFKELDGQ